MTIQQNREKKQQMCVLLAQLNRAWIIADDLGLKEAKDLRKILDSFEKGVD